MSVIDCFQLLANLMKSQNSASTEIVDDAMLLIRDLDNNSESEKWTELGNHLLAEAKCARSKDIASYYTIIGCACLGHAVELHHLENQG